MSIDTADFEFIRDLLRKRCGVILEAGKEYLVETRLTPLAEQVGFASLHDFISRLKGNNSDSLCTSVVEALTINETLFFRDVHPFNTLKKSLLPELIERRSTQRRLNLWCAAASSGQEPYSVAMVLVEHFPQLVNWHVRLIASDFSDAVLERAQRGRFSQIEVNRGLPAPLLVRYFRKEGRDWQLSEKIRNQVEFCKVNLVKDWPPLPPMDVIFMRNILIYFDVETKKAVLGKMRRVLKPDGYLFLGSAETTLNLDAGFERLQIEGTVVYKLRS